MSFITSIALYHSSCKNTSKSEFSKYNFKEADIHLSSSIINIFFIYYINYTIYFVLIYPYMIFFQIKFAFYEKTYKIPR